jgi:hypothetical protein
MAIMLKGVLRSRSDLQVGVIALQPDMLTKNSESDQGGDPSTI